MKIQFHQETCIFLQRFRDQTENGQIEPIKVSLDFQKYFTRNKKK